jgi:hypothetical protein
MAELSIVGSEGTLTTFNREQQGATEVNVNGSINSVGA